ncbi:MAG: leucine-rich repeat domain-containing protein [Bacteroidaceae bacterium]|nr:leucine-rich repeat domain-containing protein [Bacteroidaceae bacterium]
MANAKVYEHVSIGDLYYDIDDDAKTATVTYESLNPEENYASLAETSVVETNATISWQGKTISVIGIRPYAFAGSPISVIRFEENIKSIGNYAFSGCERLRYVWKYESLETIGEHAFSGCNKLEHLYLPEGLTKIGADAFYGCTGVAHISLPSTLNSIGARAFGGCSALKEITSYIDGIVILNEASKVFDGVLRLPEVADDIH